MRRGAPQWASLHEQSPSLQRRRSVLLRLVVEVLSLDIRVDVFGSVVRYNKEQSKADKMSIKKANLSEHRGNRPLIPNSHLSLLLRENEHDMTRAYDCRAKNEHQSMGTIGEHIGTLPDLQTALIGARHDNCHERARMSDVTHAAGERSPSYGVLQVEVR
jgi:hypothetical protein